MGHGGESSENEYGRIMRGRIIKDKTAIDRTVGSGSGAAIATLDRTWVDKTMGERGQPEAVPPCGDWLGSRKPAPSPHRQGGPPRTIMSRNAVLFAAGLLMSAALPIAARASEAKSPVAPPPPFAASPEWFRRSAALYVPTARSAGAVMVMFESGASPKLHDRISSFRELPKLLDQAEALGTRSMHLVDYFEGRPGDAPSQYWTNKGDYIPRSDLGGAEALRDGLAAVRQRGGHVIAYVEGFIISKQSEVGQAHGAEWSIQTPKGPPVEPYPGNWKLCPACQEWRAYLVEVCRRLVGEYGFDGVFVDSYGFQRDWKCVSPTHGHPLGDSHVFNDGCAEMLREIREAIQSIKPEAVVMVEGPTLFPLYPYIDGAQDWGIHTLSRRPIWTAAGSTDVFTAGWSLDDAHRILAAGHKLCLGSYWLESPHGVACADDLPTTRTAFPREEGRRAWAEDCFETLHQWRNAGLLLGVRMPVLDDVTPMRMQAGPWFASEQKLDELMMELRRRASAIDAALGGRRGADLPSAASNLRPLVEARSRLSPIIDDGATMTPLETGQPYAQAFFFSSPKGCALTMVSFADDPASIHVQLPTGAGDLRFESLADSPPLQTAPDGAVSVDLAPHSMGLWGAK